MLDLFIQLKTSYHYNQVIMGAIQHNAKEIAPSAQTFLLASWNDLPSPPSVPCSGILLPLPSPFGWHEGMQGTRKGEPIVLVEIFVQGSASRMWFQLYIDKSSSLLWVIRSFRQVVSTHVSFLWKEVSGDLWGLVIFQFIYIYTDCSYVEIRTD